MNEMSKGIKRLFGGDMQDEQVVIHGVTCQLFHMSLGMIKLGRGHPPYQNE